MCPKHLAALRTAVCQRDADALLKGLRDVRDLASSSSRPDSADGLARLIAHSGTRQRTVRLFKLVESKINKALDVKKSQRTYEHLLLVTDLAED